MNNPLRTRRAVAGVVAACLLAGALVAWVTARVSERLMLDEIGLRAAASLDLQAATLESLLDKYRILPPILSRRPDVVELSRTRDRETAHRIAATAAGMTGAEEIRFLAEDGSLIGSSDIDAVGNAFDTEIREAVEQAREGRLGRQLLITHAGRPASYIFASAVRADGGIVGVVAARVDLARVEQAWALSRDPVLALDEAGGIIATNRPQWRGLELSLGDTRSELEGLHARPERRGGHLLVSLPSETGRRLYLQAAKKLPVLDWSVAVFFDASSVTRQAATAALIAILATLIVTGLVWIVLERRLRLQARLRGERAAALRLERRVRDRTRDLRRANQRLGEEVRERETAERELRRTQDELVQTAKLATLGQMSAALSHEFNQPLAVIRSQADNAGLLVQRGRCEEAGESLRKITAMVERMATISRTLKGFARKSGTQTRTVPVGPVIDETLMLLSPRIKGGQTAISFERPPRDLAVRADSVLLEQVMMNLIVNALDAVGEEGGTIRVTTVREEPGMVVIRVADDGPGIDAATRGRIFDPFFTTKEVGAGLGLGLSIADKIIRDFGGQLALEDMPVGERGTIFAVRLPEAELVAAG
ncbi:two-component system C4-dicarboxylate transport sensor histidine kinase DctB [Breoghania corrubedonensis]|uniref:C4-dicarboxylate transport sensor protein DctB n=1 Tax=Breoghania corrubedonensis TaxID=665038 RepID=A0A2T5V6P4_9HYPH|nr:ATP-binding protein [Breoghania corrubedonensis]PTW59422.1 two-component system C4-dicarboxylate transport sensor histidine kinase DctB [Breoghania corrubedonensis]